MLELIFSIIFFTLLSTRTTIYFLYSPTEVGYLVIYSVRRTRRTPYTMYMPSGFQTFANSFLSVHVRAMKLHMNVPWHCPQHV